MNKQVVVARRASGIPDSGTFLVVDGSMPLCPDDGVVVKVLFSAVDPGMRGWVSTEQNYMTVETGEVMRALGVARIVESRTNIWRAGDIVVGWFGWQQYSAATSSTILWKADTELAEPEVWLGVFGYNGLTAWLGFQHFGRPKPGETIVVSTAAGGVGGTVGQLARAAGVRAVGLTSSKKVRLATEELGYDLAIDYRKSPDLSAELAAATPHGVDIFFDNTGGAIADTVFTHLNKGARVVQCGTASIASWIPWPTGPRRERDVLIRSLSWHGFVVLDHAELFPNAMAELKSLWRAGGLTARTHILCGLDQAPAALELLYRGENSGRLVIRVE